MCLPTIYMLAKLLHFCQIMAFSTKKYLKFILILDVRWGAPADFGITKRSNYASHI